MIVSGVIIAAGFALERGFRSAGVFFNWFVGVEDVNDETGDCYFSCYVEFRARIVVKYL